MIVIKQLEKKIGEDEALQQDLKNGSRHSGRRRRGFTSLRQRVTLSALARWRGEKYDRKSLSLRSIIFVVQGCRPGCILYPPYALALRLWP